MFCIFSSNTNSLTFSRSLLKVVLDLFTSRLIYRSLEKIRKRIIFEPSCSVKRITSQTHVVVMNEILPSIGITPPRATCPRGCSFISTIRYGRCLLCRCARMCGRRSSRVGLGLSSPAMFPSGSCRSRLRRLRTPELECRALLPLRRFRGATVDSFRRFL